MRTTTEWAGDILAAADGEPLAAAHNVVSLVAACMAEARAEERGNADEPTLRDRFAMAALTGAMPAFFEEGSSWEDYDDMAGTCYQVADAMLRAREGE